MNLKRLLAFTLSMAMVISATQTLVFADETESETTGTTVVETTESKESETKNPEEIKPSEPGEDESSQPEETNPAESKTAEPSESDSKETDETKITETTESDEKEPAESNNKENTPEESNETTVSEGRRSSESASTPRKNAFSGTCGDNLEWEYDYENDKLIITGSGAMTNWSSSEEVPWRNHSSNINSIVLSGNITSIGDYAFYFCAFATSVTIPDSVITIGKNAFWGCNDLDITIPSKVTSIGDYAFYGCDGITSITLPNSVTSIGKFAFYGCDGAKSLTIPNSITTISNSAFAYCSGITSLAIPSSVTSIDDSAFSLCTGLTSVTIPNGVTSIGEFAFFRCDKITSVTIPKSVISIGERAFYGVEVLDIYYKGSKADWDKIKKDGNNFGFSYITIHFLQDNTLSVKGKTAKVKYKKLRRKAQTVSRTKVLTVSNPKGKVTYKLVSVTKKKYKKYFKINATTGKIKIKKKLRKGKYTIKCKVIAAGNEEYLPATKTVTFKIKVK